MTTDAVDNISGSVGIAHDATERLPDLVELRWLPVQEIQGCTSVVARAGDRLRDFVKQRGGHFSQHAHAVHVGEFRLQFTDRLHYPLWHSARPERVTFTRREVVDPALRNPFCQPPAKISLEPG